MLNRRFGSLDDVPGRDCGRYAVRPIHDDPPANDVRSEVSFFRNSFGYIGRVRTIPWNATGRYFGALQTAFQERMPMPDEPSEIILLDAEHDYAVRDETELLVTAVAPRREQVAPALRHQNYRVAVAITSEISMLPWSVIEPTPVPSMRISPSSPSVSAVPNA